jgi:hypothetical protein
MKKPINYLMTLFCICILIACTKDFIQKDIKNDVINVIAPADSLKTPNNTITFWWDELEGADKYNLQIVKPSFNSVIQLIVDTMVTGNKFNKVLTPGTYQWRIKGVNGGGNTVYTTRTLIIDTTSNLSLVTVSPLAPNNLLTGNSVVTFSWSPLSATDYYELNILTSAGALVHNENNISSTAFTYTLPVTTGNTMSYKWQVKAYNSFSFSSYNLPAYTFTVDRAAPTSANINHPALSGQSIVNATDSLTWTRDLSAVCDSVIISTDSNFAATPTYVVNRIYAKKIKLSTLSLTPNGAGNTYYFLRVLSMDSVRNVAAPNSKFKFKVY